MLAARSFAFFDVDDTLINEKSMFTMLLEMEVALGVDSRLVMAEIDTLGRRGANRADLNVAYYRSLAGLPREAVRGLAKQYVERRFRQEPQGGYLIQPVVEELRQLQSRGVEPVLLSGSAVDFLQPLAESLRVTHVLATVLEVDADGAYTGALKGAPMIGAGKLAAMRGFADHHQVDLGVCRAFGDHSSDLDYLASVGHASVVSGDIFLELHAKRRGWPIIRKSVARQLATQILGNNQE